MGKRCCRAILTPLDQPEEGVFADCIVRALKVVEVHVFAPHSRLALVLSLHLSALPTVRGGLDDELATPLANDAHGRHPWQVSDVDHFANAVQAGVIGTG
jgi:hypothetical protein